HINNLGFRDPRDYQLAKGARTFRIVTLGDSVTFGHSSVYEHTYPYLLEQQLKRWRPDVDWQVWNVAVPGYNTSQELAHLKEIGPQFKPDLVVVGFFENDLVDNREVGEPGIVRKAGAAVLSFLQRHVYSFDLYKKVLLRLAWKLSSSDAYRQRLEGIADDEKLLATVEDASLLKQQAITNFDRLNDDQLRGTCPHPVPADGSLVQAAQRQPGYADWIGAVRGFQRLERDGVYHVVFFLNVPAPQCPDTDEVFYDEGPKGLNALFVEVMSDGTPAVSMHDALLHVRPSQMPGIKGHSIGNSNLVKSEVLFEYLRDRVLPTLAPPPRIQTSAAAR
ncbi:MAG TPA: SGNH/GDSL hydrolase family protein, partial [Vicinamibacterales bacterium]|nr:SGNH/GDSL hydrolase family protein [Vicinamibacterales bacterium]